MLKLIISLFELTGGNDMLRTNIVVGLGFTISGEKPSNRVTVSRKSDTGKWVRAVPSWVRTPLFHQNCGFSAKPQSSNALRL